ncbi:MAG: 50S ribosomal protein L29 [Nanoarchaeota archaeon]|nr:50S ribosomal protein L29 [Nanoarchaeota archaeon]
MATLKSKEIIKMSKEERKKKLKELKIELVKSKSNVSKKENMKVREIKKIMARIYSTNK